MNLMVTGRHIEVTDALKSYVEGGLAKLRTHFDKVIDADVVLSIEKHRHIAEINLHANGIRIHGKESSSDMYASVDAVLGKLDKQIRRFKDRINRHQPRPSKDETNYNYEIIQAVDDKEVADDATAKHHVVMREKIPVKPMSVDEAVMQLELVDDQFLVFTNADTRQVNVIYARDDGTYGLIES
ncbi:MAG: ribosome-associated translation inhibitor RaiA [Candidatus Hydrogenedentes bacterium]|nr:ribosome-associated translation inhibitor RaiA [Candidatus Hydrogenedentota bacterium]